MRLDDAYVTFVAHFFCMFVVGRGVQIVFENNSLRSMCHVGTLCADVYVYQF